MQRGDISNETPPRIIVGIDWVVKSELEDKRSFLRGKEQVRKVTGLENAQLKQLWNVSFNYGIAVELMAIEDFGWGQKDLDNLMDRLERRGGNPFNYAELYSTVQDFIDELPYRANLRGVIDVPERAGMYGSWRLDLPN